MANSNPSPKKLRLDALLVERGLAESGEKARRLILAGQVLLNGQPASKPGARVSADACLEIKQPERFVSRGGHKLLGALETFAINPSGKVCLDVGASTGGFTDCLLQQGASRVYAVDVGAGLLHWRLRQDPRVICIENLNARHLTRDHIPEPPQLAVADVSFISLTLILPPLWEILPPHAHLIPLIKPQFELAPHLISRGGIVRDHALRLQALEKIRTFCQTHLHAHWLGDIPSPLPGTRGNIEFLACLRKP